jgi:hypothetical protein
MEHWWNDTDKRSQKFCEENLPQYHFVFHKFQSDWPGVEPSEKPVTNHLYGQPLVFILNNITDDSVV